MYRLGKKAGKHNRDLAPEEDQKCEKDTLVLDGTDCNKMLEWFVTLEGEHRKVKNKIVEYDLQIIAQKISAFDTYVVLNSLSNLQRSVNIVKNGKSINSVKIFNKTVKVSEKKYVPQNIFFRCGMTYNNSSLKNIGPPYSLQKEFF